EKAQDKQADSVTDRPNKTEALGVNAKKANGQKTEPDSTAPNSSTNAINKGVMSDNSTATSKTKTSSSTNGNGSAPKTKKGTLDPNRLPDSSGGSLDNVDSVDSVDIDNDLSYLFNIFHKR